MSAAKTFRDLHAGGGLERKTWLLRHEGALLI